MTIGENVVILYRNQIPGIAELCHVCHRYYSFGDLEQHSYISTGELHCDNISGVTKTPDFALGREN